MQRAAWRAQEELSSESDSTDKESLESNIALAQGAQASATENPELLVWPGDQEREDNDITENGQKLEDITEGKQCAYEWIMVRTNRVKEDYESALLVDSLEKKKEKFREICWECTEIDIDIQHLENPHLETKAAEKFLPVRSIIFGWIKQNDLSGSSQNDANTEPKETAGIGLGVAGKMLEEVNQMKKKA